jgi:SAM-dependent methyltransferase
VRVGSRICIRRYRGPSDPPPAIVSTGCARVPCPCWDATGPYRQKALTLADGEGRNGVWLAEQGLEVLALDFSLNALKNAQALAAARGVGLRIELADLSQWEWPAAEFNVVVSILIHFADPAFRRRIFAGIKRALKPGGLLLMQGYRPEQLNYRSGGPSEPENLYTRASLEEAF